MKAMLSQPMAGKTQEEIVATREKAIAALKEQGYEIVNTLFTDEWYSSEVPGAQLLSLRISESHAPGPIQKIMATGCNGALVKFKSGATLIQLTDITKKDMPDSVFVLPANYQPDKNTDLYGVQ